MALEKRVTKAVAVSGDHTLTLSDVTGLVVGYEVVIAGVMAAGTFTFRTTVCTLGSFAVSPPVEI